MDNIRLFLIVSLCFILLLIWQAWQQDYGQKRGPAVETEKPASTIQPQTDMPSAPARQLREPAPAARQGLALGSDTRVRVQTDVLQVEINTRGGDIEKARLLKYPISLDAPNEPFVLLDNSPSAVFITQGGLLSTQTAPNHYSAYRTEKPSYQLSRGQDSLQVRLNWESKQGLAVSKIYTFYRGSYLIDLHYEIRNNGFEPWKGRLYSQLQRLFTGGSRGFVYTYTGAALSSPAKRYEKIKFNDMHEKPLDRNITDGWVAMIQHYFFAALIPPSGTEYHYYSKVLDGNRYVIGLYGPELQVPQGNNASTHLQLYIGPKIQRVLAEIAPGLELTVDYGSLWFIAKPLFWLLERFHAVTGNWGWAIVLVTLIVKLAFYHLSAKSYKSMAKMKSLQPRLLAIRERYGDDRTKIGQATMELYRKEKVNPFGGCLPILVQIPVFIALYWVLLESVELRQAGFILWLKDLSSPDPYFVLPLLMGLTMLIQQKLSPPATDPMQQKVLQTFPIVFTVFFAFFPSGLVLYWVVSNALSIGQQWVINKRFGHLAHPA